MKVSVDVLQRVYTSLQDQDEGGGGIADGAYSGDSLNSETHLWFIDAYEMPRWHWSNERGAFERCAYLPRLHATSPTTSQSSATAQPSISSSPGSRIAAMRDRLDIIRQCILRNEHFAPSTIPSRDREKLVTLKSTKQLLGRPGQRFLLLGMLMHNKEGNMCLEDADGSVILDYSTLVSPL
jgi:DNA polymerase epsilon subunit 2